MLALFYLPLLDLQVNNLEFTKGYASMSWRTIFTAGSSSSWTQTRISNWKGLVKIQSYNNIGLDSCTIEFQIYENIFKSSSTPYNQAHNDVNEWKKNRNYVDNEAKKHLRQKQSKSGRTMSISHAYKEIKCLPLDNLARKMFEDF